MTTVYIVSYYANIAKSGTGSITADSLNRTQTKTVILLYKIVLIRF